MNEADRADCYAAEEEMLGLPVPEDFDWDELEVVFLDDQSIGAALLAEHSGISNREALRLLKRVYRR